MASIARTEVQTVIDNMKSLGQTEIAIDSKGTMAEIDLGLAFETQTDKPQVKLVPCRTCKRPIVVTTFFAPAKAVCGTCKGETVGVREASVGQPEPGRTDPAKAVNLADCLINEAFGHAVCPLGGEDHRMELKSVNHNDHYGPSEYVGVKNGKPEYRQLAQGETVMHQCLDCKTTVNYSTTAQHQFARQNEVRPGKHVNGWEDILGVRDETPVAA